MQKYLANYRMCFITCGVSHGAKCGIACAEFRGTSAETRFRLALKRTSPFKSVGASVQSPSGSHRVRISGQRLYYL